VVTKPYRVHTDEDVERALSLLAKNDGNVAKTAREMGISRTTLQGWKGKNHDVFVKLRREQKAIVIEKAYAPLIANLEEAIEAVKGQTSKECTEAALNLQKLITNMSDEPAEPLQVDINIEGQIDIRAVTDRTQERLQLLDELAGRGSRGLNSPPVPTEPDGTPEGDRNRDTKRFVHHEQAKSEAVVVVEQDAKKTV
jgi:transposase-like protein